MILEIGNSTLVGEMEEKAMGEEGELAPKSDYKSSPWINFRNNLRARLLLNGASGSPISHFLFLENKIMSRTGMP